MSRQNHALVAELLLLMVCFGSAGCESSESGGPPVPPLNNTANAQAPQAPQAAPGSQGVATVKIDSTRAQPVFANLTDVAPAGRHVVLDFGVKPLPGDEPAEATTSLRIYLNYYTAKRTQMALSMSIERHEAAFGAIGQDEPTELKTPPEVARRPNYANFVRLTGTPEELLMEMGINRMPVGVPTEPISIDFTVIMDFQTGKTLLEQVGSVLSQYEEEHGTIETDVQKRVVGGSIR